MLNQVRYFQAVVRLGSFTRAAEECNISQSAISQQVKALEQELGVVLLERAGRSFSLTPAGELFYNKSLVLVADCDRLVRDTVRAARKEQAELRVGYLTNYAGTAMQAAVSRFSEKHPDVRVLLMGGSHEDLYEALQGEKIDLAMSDQRRAFSDNYVNLSLARIDVCAEIAARNPISGLSRVTAEELKNTPCILIASKKQQKTEQAYFSEIIGIRSDFLFAGSPDEARLMAVQNNGFLLTDSSAERVGNTTVRVPLVNRGNPITVHYCAFWKKDNSGYYVEEFAEILHEVFSASDIERP